MYFLNKLNKIENNIKNNLIFYLIFCFIVIIINFFFSFYYIDKFPEIVDINNKIILGNLGFEFSQILENLQKGEGLKARYFETDYYVSRMPLIPLSITFLFNYVSENFYIILLVKNLFFLSIIFLILLNFKKDVKISFIFFSLIVLFYNPHNLIVTLSYNFEEGILNYLIIILFLLYLSDLKKKIVYISFVIIFIFFLKSSMFFFVTAVSMFIFFNYFKKDKFYFLPLLFLIISKLIWGSYSFYKTGYFALGTKVVSYNSFVLNHAHNKRFKSIFPHISPDILSSEIEAKLPSGIERDEWQIDNFYFDDSIDYLLNNPRDTFLGVFKKFQVVYTYMFKDSQWPDENGNLEKKIRFSNIPNKLIFIIFTIYIVRNFFKYRDSISTFFMISSIFYFFPYFTAFIYSRHCTSFYMIASFYLFHKFYYGDFFYFLKKNR